MTESFARGLSQTKREPFLHIIILAVAAVFVSTSSFPALAIDPATESHVHEDNISASLLVNAAEAELNYRFFGEVNPPVSNILATINRRTLSEPILTRYPGFGAKAAILVMLDMTDQGRAQQILRDKIDAFVLLNKAGLNQAAAIALYGEKLELAESRTGNPGENIEAEAFAPIKNTPAKLGAVMKEAVKLIAAVEADRLRRDIVVFTDGHSDDALDVDDLTSRANRADVSITFIQSESQRSINATDLKAIASKTGGRLLTPSDRGGYLPYVLTFMNSGSVARFPLADYRRFFWESNPEIRITFVHGDKQLALTAPAQIPAAGPIETARYLGSNHPYIAGGTGAAVLALVAGGIFLARRPRRATEVGAGVGAAGDDEPELRPVFAILQNIDDGTSHSISSDRVNLGRASTNDIVIDDKAVSREHAVMLRDESGQFVIESRGANGTFVNHLQIERAPLASGDLITIGDSTLRFVQTKP
jgi:hypothetical protein